MSDIRAMVQSIGNSGLLKPNRFTVDVTFPDMLLAETEITQNQVTLPLATRISRVTIPENAIEVYEIVSDARTTLPIARSRATFEPVALGLILSEDGREREYFENWLEMIHGRKSGYSPLFYDNYISPGIIVNIIDTNNEPESATKFYFYNVYPISVGDIELSYDENDEYVLCTVTMNYESFGR